MNRTSSTVRTLVVSVAALLLFSACTPEQLQTVSQLTGRPYTPAETERLLSLPDIPFPVAGKIVHPDGSMTDDPVAYVNSLPYSYMAKEPVIEAFRVVTRERGWTPEQTASWEVALWDIAAKEANGCWNVRYGARFAYHDGRGCILSRSGRAAAGYGQITQAIMHIPCSRAWICSGAEIVASPWNSMAATVAVIEESGVRPWCYNGYARRFHRVACNNPGLDVP